MDQLQNLISPQSENKKVSGGFLNQIGKIKLGALSFIALTVLIGSGYLIFSAFGLNSSEPPALMLETSTLAQGMARSSVKQIPGFAKFTKEDVEAYECNPRFEITLGNRVANVFAKQKTSLKEIVSAIHPVEGSQYLIAFYDPSPLKDGLKPTYYIYPTEKAPFVSNRFFKVQGITDGEFEIPAYRGFSILTDNADTLLCKGSLFKTVEDGIWYTKDGKEISFEVTAKILKSMRVLPKGWVMLPAGNNTAIIGGFHDLFGKDVIKEAYYMADSGDFKKFDYDKDWNSSAETGTKLKYNAVWFYLKKDVNVAHIIDEILRMLEEQNGGPVREVREKKVKEVEETDEDSEVEVDSKADTESDLDSDAEANSDDGLTEDVTDESTDPTDYTDTEDSSEAMIDEYGEKEFYSGNSVEMMTDESFVSDSRPESFKVIDVNSFNDNELAICFNVNANQPNLSASDVFSISDYESGDVLDIFGWGSDSYSDCENYLSVIVNQAQFISGNKYVLTIKDFSNYSFVFEI